MLHSMLQGGILCAFLLIVFGLPEGPPRDFVSERDDDGDDNDHETDYIPWVDEEGSRCMFENSTLPLDTCISTYGQDEVDFWPTQNPNLPGPKGSIPGANIGR